MSVIDKIDKIDKWVDRFMIGVMSVTAVLAIFCVGMIVFMLVRGPQTVEYQTPDGGTVMCTPSGRSCDWGGSDGS